MPDPKTIELLRGLVLSASDLKGLTDWPDALVEDYLNILDNLILLANTLDVETDKNLDKQIYSAPANKSYDSRIKELEQKLLTLESPKSYEQVINDVLLRLHSEPAPKSYEQIIKDVLLHLHSEPAPAHPSLDNIKLKMIAELYHISPIHPPVAHGCCHGTAIAWSQANAVQNTWYPISDADMTDGILHNAEHDGSGKITVYPAGHYLVLWDLSGGNTSNDDDTEIAISVSGTETDHGKVTFQTPKANYFFAKAGHALLEFTANEYIEISIRTIDNNTPTLTVDSLNLSVILIDILNA